jgi:hypothetical protein
MIFAASAFCILLVLTALVLFIAFRARRSRSLSEPADAPPEEKELNVL